MSCSMSRIVFARSSSSYTAASNWKFLLIGGTSAWRSMVAKPAHDLLTVPH
jgi:hypothetical protein